MDYCTRTLYGVKAIDFIGSEKGKGGSFKGNGPLWENGGYDKDFTVRNNVTAFTKAEAKTWVNAYYKDNNIGPIPPNYDVYGFTPPFEPRLNYTASDLGAMDMLVTQVHELGHSLNNLINLKYPADLGGQKLEDCVKQKGGFKYK